MAATQHIFLLSVLVAMLLSGRVSADPVLTAVSDAEKALHASIGFYLHDLHTDETLEYAAHTRFPMNSTFKLFACAALLVQVEEGRSRLHDTVDLQGVRTIAWSPGVTDLIANGRSHASLNELCRMMLSVSDNTAANLVLAEIGGPDGFTAFMRSIGDAVTRLDRWEPELNEGLSGDPRDTTTAHAIGRSLEYILLGEGLIGASRETLRDWLSGHRVADELFRSALPATWSIDDRTGAGEHGTRGIVAVMYPPQRAPIVATVFMRDADASLKERNAAVARIGEAIVLRVGRE